MCSLTVLRHWPAIRMPDALAVCCLCRVCRRGVWTAATQGCCHVGCGLASFCVTATLTTVLTAQVTELPDGSLKLDIQAQTRAVISTLR